jgi:MarR family 2-MHQ and catechol resistance regulon transcriptional repressor
MQRDFLTAQLLTGQGPRVPAPSTDDDRVALFRRMTDVQGRHLSADSTRQAARCGVPLVWFDVLACLGREEDEQLTMGALAGQVSLTTGGVTRLVDHMEAAGLVERIASPSDRRVMYVTLADAGSAKSSEASDVHGAVVRAAFEGFSDRELAVMGRLLGRLGDVPV